jgi:hypothetical protein
MLSSLVLGHAQLRLTAPSPSTFTGDFARTAVSDEFTRAAVSVDLHALRFQSIFHALRFQSTVSYAVDCTGAATGRAFSVMCDMLMGRLCMHLEAPSRFLDALARLHADRSIWFLGSQPHPASNLCGG